MWSERVRSWPWHVSSVEAAAEGKRVGACSIGWSSGDQLVFGVLKRSVAIRPCNHLVTLIKLVADGHCRRGPQVLGHKRGAPLLSCAGTGCLQSRLGLAPVAGGHWLLQSSGSGPVRCPGRHRQESAGPAPGEHRRLCAPGAGGSCSQRGMAAGLLLQILPARVLGSRWWRLVNHAAGYPDDNRAVVACRRFRGDTRGRCGAASVVLVRQNMAPAMFCERIADVCQSGQGSPPCRLKLRFFPWCEPV